MRSLAWTLVVILGCALAGCGGSSGAPPSPPSPPSPGTVTVTAPGASSTVTALPVTVTLSFSNGAALSASKVTLDGTDITSKFISSGSSAQAQVNNSVYVGNNRIAVTVGTGASSQIVKSQFTYDPTVPGAGPTLLLPDVIPVQTRVQMTNSQGQQLWGIQVGQTAYPSNSTPGEGGFQVVWLQRSNLSLVFNDTYPLVDATDLLHFLSVIIPGPSPTGACGYAGCLEIIQSLDTIGFNPCTTTDLPDCITYGQAFEDIGGTSAWTIPESDSGNLAYSFIGNIGGSLLHAGSNFERFTCASSDGCVKPNPQQNSNNNQIFLNGIAPNGVDGVMPNLANTGSSGTTTISATAAMPAMTVSNNGAIAGELVLDNTNNYTFAYASPPIHFEMGVAPDNPNKNLLTLTIPAGSQMTFPDGTTVQNFESATLPPNPSGSPVGGFRLVVFDATTFQNLANNTYVVNPNACPLPSGKNYCIGPDGTPIYHLDQLESDILSFNSRRNLIFVASMGTLDHDIYTAPYSMQDVWDRVGQSIQDIGGTYATFVSLNNPAYAGDTYDQYTANTVPEDDYTLIGQWWINGSGVSNPYALEESSQISRQTEKYPVPSNVQGVLEKENDGYYQVKLETKYADLLPDLAFTLTSAPLLPPSQWPLTGPNDSAGVQAAYAWTSQQLLNCTSGCADIREAYTNLNQSPTVWLNLLSNLELPADCADLPENPACPLRFNENDFDTVKNQLLTEFQYLAVLREYQNNVVGLLQAEQANISVILQQTTDEVLGNINYNNTSSSYGISDWRTDVERSFGILGAISGFASFIPGASEVSSVIAPVAGITDFILDASAKHTNDANGRSLIEQAHDQVAASGLAQKAADQYAQTLTSVGADFGRIARDWGRLQAVAAPIVNNDLQWDSSASGYLLQGFDTAIRRSFYQSLMSSGYWAIHYRYAAPGVHPNPVAGYSLLPNSSQCGFYNDLPYLLTANPDSYAYIPGALIDSPGSTVQDSLNLKDLYPYDLWWDVWALQQNTDDPTCAPANGGDSMPSKAFFDTTGLFRPLDPADPTPLGFYKIWFYQRSGIPINEQINTSYNFWYDNSADGYPPYNHGAQNWNPDPDNY